MKAKTMLFALMLTLASSVAIAQTPSGSSAGQSVTAPDPQAVPDNTANAGNSGGNGMGTPQNNAALQSRIEDAIRNEPTLGNSHVSVNVNDDAIDLSGTVGSTKDKQTAERIAESFDGN
jgi:osmotically-inducible protein OsmY